MKTIAIDHSVLTLRIIGNPAAPRKTKEQLESMSDDEFYQYMDDVQASIASHSKLEVNEVLRRKVLDGWELFSAFPIKTSFNQDGVANASTTEYVFVKYEQSVSGVTEATEEVVAKKRGRPAKETE